MPDFGIWELLVIVVIIALMVGPALFLPWMTAEFIKQIKKHL